MSEIPAKYKTKKTDNEKDAKLKSAILRRLKLCYGIDNAISLNDIFLSINSSPGKKLDAGREIRNAINELRNEGYLICSLSGTSGRQSGYYLPATLEEYKQYRAFHMSYAKNIFDTIRSMDRAARKEFEIDHQPWLFNDLPEEKEFDFS